MIRLTKRFPKHITIKLKKKDAHRFFHGETNFNDNVIILVLQGFKDHNLLDLITDKYVKLLPVATYHHFYGSNSHSSTYCFKSTAVEAEVDVKYCGHRRLNGQIEHVKIKITKCEVPKVVFTHAKM